MTPVIRLARAGDASCIYSIYAPVVAATPISFELEPPSVEVIEGRIAKTLPRWPWLVCEQGDQFFGYAYASQHRERAAYQWAVDVSVYVDETWRGQGIGRALYTSLFALLHAQGYYHVYGGITLPNRGSVALHEAMDMRPVGVYRHVGFKLGAWHDVGWWQGALGELLDPPAPPKSLEDLAPGELEACLSVGVASLGL